MRADDASAGLSVLAACTSDVRLWYMQNGLQLNPDKSEALIVGTSSQLKQVLPVVPSVTVAGVNLPVPVSGQMKVLGVILDRRLTFEKHATAVAKSCNYHAEAIRHIRHFLTPELARTLACSLILLYGAPTGTVQKLQCVQNNAARIVLQMPRRSHAKPLLHSLYWLPVDQRIIYKMAVVTFITKFSATPAYFGRHLQPCNCVRNLRLLCQPLTKTDLARRGFRYSAAAVWNSLPRTVLESPSITVFKSRLKTHLFDLAHINKRSK